MNGVPGRRVGMMGRFFVLPTFVMLGGLTMMAGGLAFLWVRRAVPRPALA